MGRVPQLDILRTVAITFVILNHAFSRPEATGFMRPFAFFMRYRLGWTGVDLFFVLSGFLIGGLLMAEMKKRGKLDFGRFIIRRGFKIWPAYLVFISYCFVAAIVLYHQPLARVGSEMVKLVLQVQNYTVAGRVFLWSLAVEEHFYLLLPLALLYITRRGQRGIHAIPAITAFMMIGCLALRILTWQLHPKYDIFTHHSPSHLRMDSLMVGVFLAYLFHFQPEKWSRLLSYRAALLTAAPILLAPALICGTESPITSTIGFTGLALGYACIMVAFLATSLDRSTMARELSVMAGVGVYSYSIYLWHIDFGIKPAWWIVSSLGLSGGVGYFLFAVLSVACAAAAGAFMAWLIEKPTLALRDRLFPRYAAPFREAQAAAVVSIAEPASAQA